MRTSALLEERGVPSDVELLIAELGRSVVELDLLESEEVSTLPAASSASKHERC